MALVIVGLGNPGKEYEKTRHNAGRSAVELIASAGGGSASGGKQIEFVFNKKANALVGKGTIGGENATLVLPETMMNASGRAVAAFVPAGGGSASGGKSKQRVLKNLLVIHDDLDLPLGTVKMVCGRGSGGHKGVESIMRAVKTKDFARIRIGISPKKSGPAFATASAGKEEKVIKHVIGKWKPAEEAAFKKVLKKAALAARLFAVSGIDAATQFANTR